MQRSKDIFKDKKVQIYKITRDEAERLLVNQDDGTWLIRESSKNGMFAVSKKKGDIIKHYLYALSDGYWTLVKDNMLNTIQYTPVSQKDKAMIASLIQQIEHDHKHGKPLLNRDSGSQSETKRQGPQT